jgi:hypothetical protein
MGIGGSVMGLDGGGWVVQKYACVALHRPAGWLPCIDISLSTPSSDGRVIVYNYLYSVLRSDELA